MLKYTYLLLLIMIFSCNENEPYEEFEEKLVNQVCECISLSKSANENNFLEKYEDCSTKTSELLKNGLDKYPEDPRMSKEVYIKKIPIIIQRVARRNKC